MVWQPEDPSMHNDRHHTARGQFPSFEFLDLQDVPIDSEIRRLEAEFYLTFLLVLGF
jgi:hypothetical protein